MRSDMGKTKNYIDSSVKKGNVPFSFIGIQFANIDTKTVKRHQDGIINYIDFRISNGVLDVCQ